MNEKYDLVIIGAGPGGSAAAFEAMKCGMKVALIEKDNVGGTCLNRGCIPTKALLHATELLNECKNFEKLGIFADKVSYDINKMNERKKQVVDQLRSGLESLLVSSTITVLNGCATIKSPHKVAVVMNDCTQTELTTDNILIATGSVPIKPKLPGFDLDDVITSDELLKMNEKVPSHLVIIGGGVIGVEFATIYSAMGTQVTILEAADRILSGVDVDISRNLSAIMKKRGIAINTSSTVTKIEKTASGDGLSVFFNSNEENKITPAEIVLVSVGRRPNTDGLVDPSVGINMQRGAVEVNENFRTNVPSVYAIGDVVHGGAQLAHVASAAGINAVLAMNNRKKRFVMENVPACVYTEPEIACVGITKDIAQKMGIAVKVGKYPMNANARTLISIKDRGFVKLVFNAETDEIVGAQMMCANATDMINEITTAICNRLTYSELSGVIRPHPTFGEAITEIFNGT